MSPLDRREFMRGSTAVLALSAAGAKGYAANDKVVVGVMGLGGRGTFLAERFARQKDVEVAWLCDVDKRRFGRAREAIQEIQERAPKTTQDFRKILDDGTVHALVNATPDHWHALGTILACRAGKDIYVEKPLAHNLWEGRKMVEAARKYKRVVQVGTQSRSAAYVREARDYLRSGRLGEIRLVRVYNMMQHAPQNPGPEVPVPEGFDYEIWCGPAAKPPYTAGRRWLNLWEYSCGPIAGDAVHQIDLARYLLGDPPAPKAVTHVGGIWVLQDGRDTPDTQLATFEYDGFSLLFQAALWTPYMHKIPAHIRDGDLFPDWPFCATKVEILGTRQYMTFGRHGGGWQVYDEGTKVVEQRFGRQADNAHIEDFLRCVRTREVPAADVEQGHQSTLLCHLANIAWKAGNGRFVFDGKTETFPEAPAANAWIRRAAYREPWTIPDPV